MKHAAELRWWLDEWNPILQSGGFNPGDAPMFLDGEEPATTYEGRRWQQAKAEVRLIPLLSGSVDVVVARNSLDHVDDPRAVLRETQRLLRPGGTLILNFDVDHAPTVTEPHALTREKVCGALQDMTIVHERTSAHPHGHDGQMVVMVAQRS